MPVFAFTGACPLGHSRNELVDRVTRLLHSAVVSSLGTANIILVMPSVDFESAETLRARSIGCQGLLYADFLIWLGKLERGNKPYPLPTFDLGTAALPAVEARERRRVLPQPIWDVIRADCSLEKLQPRYGLDDRAYDFLIAWGSRLGFNVGFCSDGGLFRYRVLWRDRCKDRSPGLPLVELLGEVEALRLDTLEACRPKPRERRRRML